MVVKYMKEVKIHVFYVKRCQVFKISLIFIAYNTGHGAKNGS